jgi:phospholipid/cholesterol/gamma-HCH transport system permease protein
MDADVKCENAEMEAVRDSEDTLLITISGSWCITGDIPSVAPIFDSIRAASWAGRLAFDTRGLVRWDSRLLTYIKRMVETAVSRGIEVDQAGLPDGIQKLLGIAMSTARATPPEEDPATLELLYRLGEASIGAIELALDMLGFVGELSVAFVRFLVGRARFRRIDFLDLLQECGAQALPIVTVIGLLIGVILAFVGAVQLRLFGAQAYVADLVAIATVREMGPLMTAIVMAGRSGAAFAATIGTMTVSEEVDALETSGFSPMEFLVLPRVLALTIMLPLLALYTDFMAIVGGAIVGVGAFEITLGQYVEQTRNSVPPLFFGLGLIKATIYGLLVALAGCYYGMRSGRSASAVGSVTTSAVVVGVILIIVATAITTVVYDILGV